MYEYLVGWEYGGEPEYAASCGCVVVKADTPQEAAEKWISTYGNSEESQHALGTIDFQEFMGSHVVSVITPNGTVCKFRATPRISWDVREVSDAT